MKQILVISAHPDDMEIGMGGTVAKMVAAGVAVTSMVLTDGRRSPNPFAFIETQMAEIRRAEAERAAAVLGVSEVILCGLADLKSEKCANEAREKLRETCERLNPDEIYTLHPELDRHSTHRLAGQLLQHALEGFEGVPQLWAYEVWGLFPHWDRFEDISSTIGLKLKAIEEHRSQIAAIPYGEGIQGLNRWRAIFADPSQAKSEAVFAEVFIRLPLKSGK